MKKNIKFKQVLVVSLLYLFTACEDFLEIEAPDNKIVSEVVFNNDETAKSAMTGIYNQLFNASFSSGAFNSVTLLAGLSADDLTTIRANNLSYLEFDQHEVQPNNVRNFDLWSSSYNIIYMINSLLEGLEKSENISDYVRTRLEGEAKFVRAFTYFYLVNLYGEVPLILTTDYRVNALATREPEVKIYQQIVEDLETAIEVLGNDYINGERTNVNSYTAISLLARVNLYLQNWDQAESLSSQIISGTGTFDLLEDLDLVFLKNSREAIWQISPIGRGLSQSQTNEGQNFIIPPTFTFLSHVKLQDDFIESFEEQDKRLTHWTKFHPGLTVYHPFKYKIRFSNENITEYSMVLRLAEQYLIRAEARAMQNDLFGAISDLDIIRNRAGLELFAATYSEINREELLQEIMKEKRRELFTEWGHRWLDLKRTGKAGEVLGDRNSLWQETDVLYPIPEAERMKNPNLTQNTGY